MTTATYTISRARFAQIASFIGVTGILLGIVGLIWRGGSSASYGIASLAIGGVGLVAWASLTPREFRDTITGKRVRYGTVTVLSVALLIGIVTLTYALLDQTAIRLDVTQNGTFTLSPETHQVLSRLQRPVRLTGFYTARSLRQQAYDDQFFSLYTDASGGLVTRAYVDPEQNQAMADRFGVSSDRQLYISYVNEDGSADFSTLARVPRGVSQERDVTEAISRLLISGTIKVYFDTGSGERDPLDTSAEGLSGVNAGIQESGLRTAPIDLIALAGGGGEIPADAASIILSRPLNDFSPDVVSLLERYLNRGGSLLIMTDVLFSDDPFLKEDGPFNTWLWQNYGIRALDAAVVDPDAYSSSPLEIFSAVTFPESAIGERLDPQADTPTLFRLARAVEVNLDSPPENIASGRVIMTSPAGYGERDLTALGDTNTYGFDPATDLAGPVTTVVWAENQQTGGRVVLIGDSDFAANGLVMAGGNGILFTDALAWLTRFGEQIQFAPQAYTSGLPTVMVMRQDVDFVVFLTVLLIPAAILVAGVSIWARRTRR